MAFNLKLTKKQNNAAYGLGAAIVIVGALMKIIHKDLDLDFGTDIFPVGWVIGGNTLLTVGLVTEAIIFALSAFDKDLAKEDIDWSLVYPELNDGAPKTDAAKQSPQGMLSKKLDAMLQEAKIDAKLFTSLSSSIKDFESSAKAGADSSESLAKINKEFADNANNLQKQMGALASNLESLNSVYGGVLSAMNKK
jgi:gliding motility-associated protein GldL|tara:strand:+ start:31 stop:612 length:582 start_codon:yes stop_codon:yes gene_type:complete